MVELIYPDVSKGEKGRGAWSSVGGTLSVDGTKPGLYYRAPAGAAQMPGLRAALGIKEGKPVYLNDYAVHMAVKAIQEKIGVTVDGILGPKSDEAIKKWQTGIGVTPDGIIGQETMRAAFEGSLKYHTIKTAQARKVPSKVLVEMMLGHTGHESAWDIGAIGWATPMDVGVNQINGRWHPTMSEEDRLTPHKSFKYASGLVADNLEALDGDEDAAIFAYNVGIGGARQWVKAGKPEIHPVYTSVNAYHYINSVKKWM